MAAALVPTLSPLRTQAAHRGLGPSAEPVGSAEIGLALRAQAWRRV